MCSAVCSTSDCYNSDCYNSDCYNSDCSNSDYSNSDYSNSDCTQIDLNNRPSTDDSARPGLDALAKGMETMRGNKSKRSATAFSRAGRWPLTTGG